MTEVFELRQYTLHPGRRDVLIELFDRELVETQEAVGMRVVGQFRDIDDPDRFVWVRGFADLAARGRGLAAFYGGPVWKAHCTAANATMIDSDDVLQLRPAAPSSGFDLTDAVRPPVGAASPPSLVTATIYYLPNPVDDAFIEFFDHAVRPVLAKTGAPPLAVLRTETAENNFPALPIRTGENVVVWFASFATEDDHREHGKRLAESATWAEDVLPTLSTRLARPPEELRLSPTGRSLVR